jgi:hypothetical protein
MFIYPTYFGDKNQGNPWVLTRFDPCHSPLRREWLDMKLLLGSSTSKRPEMLHSLKEDKREYKRVTLDSQIVVRPVVVMVG